MPPSTYHIESLTEYESDGLEGQALADFALFSDAYDNLKARVAEIAALVNYNTSSWTWVSIDTGHWYPNDIYDSLAQIYSRLITLAHYTGTYGTLPDFPAISRTWELCHSDGSDLDAEDYTIDFTEYPGYSPYYNSSHKYYAPKLTCNSLTFYNDIVDIINNLRWAKRIPLYALARYSKGISPVNDITIYRDETKHVTLAYRTSWFTASEPSYTTRGGYGDQSIFPGMDSLLQSPLAPPYLHYYGLVGLELEYMDALFPPAFPGAPGVCAGVCAQSGPAGSPPYATYWNCFDYSCSTPGVITDKWTVIKTGEDYEMDEEQLLIRIGVSSLFFKYVGDGDYYPALTNWPSFYVGLSSGDLLAEWSGSSTSESPTGSNLSNGVYAQFWGYTYDEAETDELPDGDVEYSLTRTVIQMDPDTLAAWTSAESPTIMSAQQVGQIVSMTLNLSYSYYIL